jgi:thiamine monophosphate synthase
MMLLETAVRHFLVRAKNSATVSEAKQYLRLVEILAAEAVRLMVESHADIGSFLERVCRDFEHGDEQDEFARIYRDLQRGDYPV